VGMLEDLNDVKQMLSTIRNYDANGFANQLKYWVKELHFFYNRIVPNQTNNPSTSFYEIPPAQRPKEGQVAYFNLRRGYPKELYDGHYCYVLKDFGSKYVIIPTTSVKSESSILNPNFEFDIKIKDFENDLTSRMQISDIRSVDIQRLNGKRNIYDVETDREEIVKNVNRILSLTIDKTISEVVKCTQEES
jgi:hypothetical protein